MIVIVLRDTANNFLFDWRCYIFLERGDIYDIYFLNLFTDTFWVTINDVSTFWTKANKTVYFSHNLPNFYQFSVGISFRECILSKTNHSALMYIINVVARLPVAMPETMFWQWKEHLRLI